MEPQNELAVILNKRKARTEGSEHPAVLKPTGTAASNNERESPVKAFKSKFESSQTDSNVKSSGTVKDLVPLKPTNVSNSTVDTKGKVSDIASQFCNQIKANSDGTDCKKAFARQTSDMPLMTNVKELRENLFLTINQNKQLRSGGSNPGSASPVMRSKNPTPGVAENTPPPPPLQKKKFALLLIPGQVSTPSEHPRSETKHVSGTKSSRGLHCMSGGKAVGVEEIGMEFIPESNLKCM